MTWYMVSAGPRATHRGVLARGRILTDCGDAFKASDSVRLNLAPGENPPDPERICPRCAGQAR